MANTRADLRTQLLAAGLPEDQPQAGWRGVHVRGRRLVLIPHFERDGVEVALITSRDPSDTVPQWPQAFETTVENARAWATDDPSYSAQICTIVMCTVRARPVAMGGP